METTLEQIKADANEARSNWNGEDERGEEKANIAEDLLEAIRNVEELWAEFQGYDGEDLIGGIK